MKPWMTLDEAISESMVKLFKEIIIKGMVGKVKDAGT